MAELDPSPPTVQIAYFSMEIGLESSIPTYAGGLGVLAGDTIRAAADQEVSMVAVSLVHRHGYFRQQLDERGVQTEAPAPWTPESRLKSLEPQVEIMLEGRRTRIRAFRYAVQGVTGHTVDVLLLDTDIAENGDAERGLTDVLYGGDNDYRLRQEAVLGIGGVLMLRALGYTGLQVFHMNEGHSALLTLSLLEERTEDNGQAIVVVRDHCVFTTHTPVPAGHDQFALSEVRRVLGDQRVERLAQLGCCLNGRLNMTYLALFFSRHINGVAMRHGQVSRDMFPEYPIASITNGVHAATWVAGPFQTLFDRHISNWREENDNLRYAIGIPLQEIADAHAACKQTLIAELFRRTGEGFRADALTLGFARRATAYKRTDMLISNLPRLRAIAKLGPLQIVYSGKAHPRDSTGKELIRKVVEAGKELGQEVSVAYLEDYDMRTAGLLCAGVDVWVNTPHKPWEASGTSGMKAALNGVPSLSVLDGWWIEGHVEGVTGWAVGEGWETATNRELETSALYDKLQHIAVLFHGDSEGYRRVMRHAIALNGSFFNAERMIQQYEATYRHRTQGALEL